MITLDNGLDHTRPNTLGPRSLGELNAAIDAALARDDVAALMITGKPFILAAGADLSGVPKITALEQAQAIARIGHAVFDKLHTAPIPTFAFINGLALGGGLELGLHCDYRTISAAAPGIALPECFLGMFPGWGGAYLLPNLIGADRAVTVIIENALNQNTMLTGKAAYELGIADALFDGADFLERSLDWAGRVVAGTVSVERPEVDRGEAWDAAVDARPEDRRREDLRCRTGAVPGAGADGGGEDRRPAGARTPPRTTALAELMMSPQLRAGLYAFDLVQKRAKRPAGAPDRGLARPVVERRRRRCRADGQPAGAAVRAPARGAGDHHRPGPGAGGPRAGLRPRRDRQARWPRSGSRPTRRTGCAALVTGTVDLAAYAELRLRDRGGLRGARRSSSRSSPSWRSTSRQSACWPPTRPRCR